MRGVRAPIKVSRKMFYTGMQERGELVQRVVARTLFGSGNAAPSLFWPCVACVNSSRFGGSSKSGRYFIGRGRLVALPPSDGFSIGKCAALAMLRPAAACRSHRTCLADALVNTLQPRKTKKAPERLVMPPGSRQRRAYRAALTIV